MKLENNYCVYWHKNTVNGKSYFGITKYGDNPNGRWKNGKGYYQNKHFSAAIDLYGWDAFEHIILKKHLTKQQAGQIEIELIDKYKTLDDNNGYNKDPGGTASSPTDETKKKISKRQRGENNSMYGTTGELCPSYGRNGKQHYKSKACLGIDKNNGMMISFESGNLGAEWLKRNGWPHASRACILEVCNGKRDSAYGYYWEFID